MSFETPNLDRPPNMNRLPCTGIVSAGTGRTWRTLSLGPGSFSPPGYSISAVTPQPSRRWPVRSNQRGQHRSLERLGIGRHCVPCCAFDNRPHGTLAGVGKSGVGRLDFRGALGAWIYRPPLPHGGLGPLDRWGAYLSYIAECDDKSRANGSNAAPIRQDLGAHSSRRPTRSGRAKRSTSP